MYFALRLQFIEHKDEEFYFFLGVFLRPVRAVRLRAAVKGLRVGCLGGSLFALYSRYALQPPYALRRVRAVQAQAGRSTLLYIGLSLNIPYTYNIFLIPQTDAESVRQYSVFRETDPGVRWTAFAPLELRRPMDEEYLLFF
jgi:hypothetical protein